MDQDDTKGQDKRNWRERLGIGAQGNAAAPVTNGAQGTKDLPKISNDFRKDPPPAAGRPMPPRVAPRPVVAAPAVRPAPMAPRANPKAINPAPASPDKLAERLRSQRDASTKLAEQRVQVAKQRAEIPPMPSPPQPRPQAAIPAGAPKPKFTFAEESEAKAALAPAPQRPTTPPALAPQNQQPIQPQLSPARPPLGGGVPPVVPAFQPRPQPQQQPPFQPQAPLGYPQAGQMPPGYPQGYGQQPVPPYRPIDPASGYAPQPGYVPQQRGFGVPPQQGGFAPPSGPRLNLPPRPTPGLNSNYQPQQEFGAPQQQAPGNYAQNSRLSRQPLRGPAPPQPQDEGYDEESFDEAPQAARGAARPTSNDYQQAYREAEYGYEEEAPRSKAPWILASLLLLALLIAGLGVLGYQKYWKPMITGQTTTQEVPAVAAPETPAKVEAEQPAATPSAGGATPTKKQIYDRIVGDQEILGGEVSTPAETPAAIPEPTPTDQVVPTPIPPAGGGTDDAAPLPIPPPPGGTGGQQGSLEPASEKQSAELITPAAGESQAAVVAETPVSPTPVADPPAPGEIAAAPPATRSLATDPVVTGTEAISDATDTDPVIEKKKIEKKKIQPVKEKVASTKLGSKPVVLVPPAKNTKLVAPKQLDGGIASNDSGDTGGGLFGDEPVAGATPVVPTVPPVKKKRTLADLFRKTPVDDPAQDQVATIDPPASPLQKPKNIAPETPPIEQASTATGGDFVVQLASFRTRQEATTEFARLKARNAGALGQFSPIISEANVGGSTRFRLSVGRMNSQAQANAVCSSLFAGGERDCLVKRR
jgi:SPOR domain